MIFSCIRQLFAVYLSHYFAYEVIFALLQAFALLITEETFNCDSCADFLSNGINILLYRHLVFLNESLFEEAVFLEELADTAAQILIKRLDNLRKLKEIAIPVFHILSDKIDSLEIKYEMKGNDGELFYPEEEKIDNMKDFYIKVLKNAGSKILCREVRESASTEMI